MLFLEALTIQGRKVAVRGTVPRRRQDAGAEKNRGAVAGMNARSHAGCGVGLGMRYEADLVTDY